MYINGRTAHRGELDGLQMLGILGHPVCRERVELRQSTDTLENSPRFNRMNSHAPMERHDRCLERTNLSEDDDDYSARRPVKVECRVGADAFPTWRPPPLMIDGHSNSLGSRRIVL